MLKLIPVSEDNWREDLEVFDHQKHYVADRAALLARAYAYRRCRSRAFVVCDDEIPVGMALYYDAPELEAYIFSQLFIDRRYQRRGYGRQAAALVLRAMRRDGRYPRVSLCCLSDNEVGLRFYRSLGFERRPDMDDGDEWVLERAL